MPKNAIVQYDPTASNNLDVAGISIAEGWAASSINDSIRAIMAHLRELYSVGTIASAATVNIGASVNEYLDVTGSTTITAFDTVNAGCRRVLRFVGPLTLTHNATTLILPSAANVTTAAGDVACFRSLGSGNWRCEFYQRANGQTVVPALDIIGLTEDTVPDVTADFVPTYDVSATINKKVKLSNFPVNISGLVEDVAPDGAADFVLTYDASATTNKKVKLSNVPRFAAVVRDEKPQNTAGGTFTQGAWRTRDLNTESDPFGIVSLSANQFTLAAGTYRISATAGAYNVGVHQARLFNASDSSVTAYGQVSRNPIGGNGMSTSQVSVVATIAASKDFRIEHQCESTASSNGFGIQANFGTEVYTVVEIEKLA